MVETMDMVETMNMKDHVEHVVRARYPEARKLTWLPCDCGTCGGRDGTMLAVSSPCSVVVAMREAKGSSRIVALELDSWGALTGFCAHLLMLPNSEQRVAAFVEDLQAFWKSHVSS